MPTPVIPSPTVGLREGEEETARAVGSGDTKLRWRGLDEEGRELLEAHGPAAEVGREPTVLPLAMFSVECPGRWASLGFGGSTGGAPGGRGTGEGGVGRRVKCSWAGRREADSSWAVLCGMSRLTRSGGTEAKGCPSMVKPDAKTGCVCMGEGGRGLR